MTMEWYDAHTKLAILQKEHCYFRMNRQRTEMKEKKWTCETKRQFKHMLAHLQGTSQCFDSSIHWVVIKSE